MPGAGKSSVASFLKEKGFEVVTMGDVVREEAERQGLEPTDINLGKMMLKLRLHCATKAGKRWQPMQCGNRWHTQYSRS
jgi:dephospho-CoA kinase